MPTASPLRLQKPERPSLRSAGSNRERVGAPSRAPPARGAPEATGPPRIMAEPVRVAVLISGRGSNMQALAEYKRVADPAYEIKLVASNVPEARGLVLARRFGFKTWAHSHKGMERAAFDQMLDEQLRAHAIELIALAGYMRLL